MRTQGEFNLSPHEQAMHHLTARESGAKDSATGNTLARVAHSRAEDLDGDVDMLEERGPGGSPTGSPRSQPSDLESMYGDEPPVRKVKKEEQEADLPVPPPLGRPPEDSRILIAFINRAETAEEPDGWVRMLRGREERYARRHAEGVRVRTPYQAAESGRGERCASRVHRQYTAYLPKAPCSAQE